MRRITRSHLTAMTTLAASFVLLGAIPALAAGPAPHLDHSAATTAADPALKTISELIASGELEASGRRCGTPGRWAMPAEELARGSQADCTAMSTVIDPEYYPGPRSEIPVVVHIITADNGITGALSDALVLSQIEILNEDYLAIPGTPGENGTFSSLRFVLAATDPGGSPTTGITRTANSTWFSDSGPFKATLSWDPTRYLNIYTNNTIYLGYATLPQYSAGDPDDGVVINYQAFGRDSAAYPYDQGRTATHEVGHYLGLFHPFDDGCGDATAPGCYSSGDLICDTNPDGYAHFDCPAGAISCGGYPAPIDNYMEYTDDRCMELFTDEQVNRMLCSLVNYRPTLFSSEEILFDGFESGGLTSWSGASPP